MMWVLAATAIRRLSGAVSPRARAGDRTGAMSFSTFSVVISVASASDFRDFWCGIRTISSRG